MAEGLTVLHALVSHLPDLPKLAYKLDILPSGLTEQNEELHARLSADEMSVADRTRKRDYEELQCTQSPTKVAPSPPRPRPVKKLRRVITNSQQSSQEQESEPVSEPASELGSTSTTQPSALESHSEAPPATTAAGKGRRHRDVLAPDSKLAKLQEKHDELKDFVAEYIVCLRQKSKQLVKVQKELEALRKENTALKKAHEEELKKVMDQAAIDVTKKEEETKKEVDEILHKHNVLNHILNNILVDPKVPQQVRTVVELDAKIHDLKRQFKAKQEELALQNHQQDRAQTTPPPKKQLVETEMMTELGRQLRLIQEEKAQMQRQMNERTDKIADIMILGRSNLSGSSQSQDSIDAGQLRSDRRSSQLSVASNEHSEPSPGDLSLTVDAVDEETKSGDMSQGLPPSFTIFGASVTADTSSSDTRPSTLSRPQMYRALAAKRAEDQESKEQHGDVEDEETKRSN